MREKTLQFTSSRPKPAREVLSSAYLELDPDKVAAYPTLRKAATILGVDPATLSRRRDVQERGLRRGRELLVPVDLALELATYYRRRRIGAVAGELLDLAFKQAPDHIDEIEGEIDRARERLAHPTAAHDGNAFLREAKRALPTALYSQVAEVYRQRTPITPGSAYLGNDD